MGELLMLMSLIWTGMIILSVLYGLFSGNAAEVGAGLMDGAAGAVTFIIGTGGAICLWCAVMEVMERCGLSAALARLLSPILRRLFPKSARDRGIMSALSANVSANILGLGNAATPMGIKAAQGMARGCGGVASRELCLLVVLNTASVQLLPTTAAALRGAYGASSPFDILPAVWVSSVISVAVGLSAAFFLGRREK